MHWRSAVGNRVWFDVADLDGGELLVQIEATKRGEVEGFVNGRKEKQGVIVARLTGFERPLALKVNHCKAIVSIHGTGDPAKWVGKWIWLYTAMVKDPSGDGRDAKCEAVRVKPVKPSTQEIALAMERRGGKSQPPPSDRDDAADAITVRAVCARIDAASTPDEVDAAIAPDREELLKMEPRHQSIVKSAKRVRLDFLKAMGVKTAVPAPVVDGDVTAGGGS